MATTIKCKKCGTQIEITEAIKKELEESIVKELKTQHDLELNNFKNQKEREMEQFKETVKIEMKQKAIDKVRKEYEAKITETKEESQETAKRNKDLQDQLKELMQQLREQKNKNDGLEIEYQKRLINDEEKIRQEVKKVAAEEYDLKVFEKDKKIKDLILQLDDAKRRAEQGSQQLQGEIQELDMENTLRTIFPQDIIEPIEKGVRGADVRQKVTSGSGKICGVILWESKRAKNWTDGWISKLKENLRAEAAHIPVIVSSVLPEEAQSGFGQRDAVWICKPALMVSVATALRNQLIEVATASMIVEKRGTLADSLYGYITSHEFRQQVQVMVEVYQEMKDQISTERRAFEKSWKVREGQLERILNGTARIVGSIQGKLGTSAFGPVKGLELLENREDNINEDKPVDNDDENFNEENNSLEDIPF